MDFIAGINSTELRPFIINKSFFTFSINMRMNCESLCTYQSFGEHTDNKALQSGCATFACGQTPSLVA